jgi:hypothetical protein
MELHLLVSDIKTINRQINQKWTNKDQVISATQQN